MQQDAIRENSITRLDVTAVRSQFPALSRTSVTGEPVAYLDAAGGTQTPKGVITAVIDYLQSQNSNTGGEFELSQLTDGLITKARSLGGAFVGGSPDCIAFGQNMTTLNFNLARALGRTLQPGDEIITTCLDHEANVSPWGLLAEDRDLVIRQVGVREDLTLDMDDLRSSLTDRTRVIAFSLASNAVGTITPAAEIADLAHSVGALAWADGVAFAPHKRINLSDLGCDIVLCSPYKFFGPHLGMAWIRPDLAESLPAERVSPSGQTPPGHRFETGTLSHEALAGFVAAVEYLASLGGGGDVGLALDAAYRVIDGHETELTSYFFSRINEVSGAQVVGINSADPQHRVGTFGIVAEGRDPATLASALGRAGVYIWDGNFFAPSLMRHIGLDADKGMLRAGVVHYNTCEDVDRLIDELDRLLSTRAV